MTDLAKYYLDANVLINSMIKFIAIIVRDPYFSKRKESQELVGDFTAFKAAIATPILQRVFASRYFQMMKHRYIYKTITLNRYMADDFALEKRQEKKNEFFTLFSQMFKELKKSGGRNFRQGRNDGCPFNVHFKGEGGQDCGGPRRDAMSNICKELMSEVLPLLKPTSNNTTNTEINGDWY